MSVMRVLPEGSTADLTWATPDDACFACGEPLEAGELAVAWSGNDRGGVRYWHERCAAGWAIAFIRDVWEAAHAARHTDPLPGKYTPHLPETGEATR